MKLIVPRPVCWKRTRMAAFGLSVLFTLPVGAQTVLNPSFENRTLGDGLVGTAYKSAVVPVTTRKVRLVLHATTKGGPAIDEFEVYRDQTAAVAF